MYHKRLQALTCFFVFNPTLAKKETDDETKKILYYFPSKNVPPDTQCAYVGLVSGIVNFSKDFSSEPAHSLHTERNRYVFDEVEKDFWITLVLKNPRKDLKSDKYGRRTVIEEDNENNGKSKNTDNDEQNSQLPSIISEYFMEDELEDSVLHTIIKSAYSTFVFFHGTFDHIVSTNGGGDNGFSKLRENLKIFFKYYLPTIQFHQLRYYADIYGFRFFAVDRTTYLTLQYLNNIVQSEFIKLHSLCVMYSGKLIWSGLDQDDMRVLYTNNQEPNDSYMYTFMAKKNNNNNKSHLHSSSSIKSVDSIINNGGGGGGGGNNNDITPDGIVLNGEFLTGPKSKDYYSVNSPIVYLSKKNRFYRLICYKLRKLKFFWLMDDETLKQPLNSTNDDIFDDMISNLDLDGDITKQLKNNEKLIDEVKNNENENDFGPLADDVTSKYFPQKLENKDIDSKNNVFLAEDVLQFYDNIQKFIEPHAEEIIKELERHEQRQNRKQNKQHSQSNFRFLYFNHQNLALKSILKAPGKKLSSDTCRTLRNIHADFEGSGLAISEVCAKCSDGWVLARKSHFGGRELYLLVDHTEASQLKDLQDHMDALQEEYFSNIFML